MPGVKGRSGRRPKPVSEHKKTGTYQPCRHAGFSNPEHPSGEPSRPVELEGLAAEEWERMVWRLRVSGTLSAVDDAAIVEYAQLFAETEGLAQARAHTTAGIVVLEENLKSFTKDELLPVFQELTKLRQLEARYASQVRQGRMAIRQYLVEFGMTPASRSRVRIPETSEKNPFEEFEGLKSLSA